MNIKNGLRLYLSVIAILVAHCLDASSFGNKCHTAIYIPNTNIDISIKNSTKTNKTSIFDMGNVVCFVRFYLYFFFHVFSCHIVVLYTIWLGLADVEAARATNMNASCLDREDKTQKQHRITQKMNRKELMFYIQSGVRASRKSITSEKSIRQYRSLSWNEGLPQVTLYDYYYFIYVYMQLLSYTLACIYIDLIFSNFIFSHYTSISIYMQKYFPWSYKKCGTCASDQLNFTSIYSYIIQSQCIAHKFPLWNRMMADGSLAVDRLLGDCHRIPYPVTRAPYLSPSQYLPLSLLPSIDRHLYS